MTREEALKSCTGFVNYPELNGYFPFRAANALVETGEFVFHQASPWGYVLRRLSPTERLHVAAEREANRFGGALSWLETKQ